MMKVVCSTFYVLLIITMVQSVAFSADIDCLKCHAALAKEKYVHPALQMGCTACHEGIDASVVPHKKTNKIDKGLSAEPPELCYGCHDQKIFTKKTVHPALEMGCTSCHNPHSSKNEKLLIAEQPELCMNCHDKAAFSKKNVHPALEMGCTSCHNPHSTDTEKLLISKPPELCMNCHDKAMFSRKNVHKPVAEGMCLKCHSPHSSDNPKLLLKEPIRVCLECHADVRKTPHAIRSYESSGHPIGLLKRGSKEFPADPARPGRKFYCGSCHDPHSSDYMKLFRYKANSAMEICINCHK
jgi:predicted CXXCH cytochrome family protein